MSDDEVLDEAEFGRDVRAAVHRLERSVAPDPAVRERAAARMRDAYASGVVGESVPRTGTAGAELTTLLTDEPVGHPRSRWLAAAAAVIVGLGLTGFLWSVRTDETTPVVDEPSVTTIDEEPALPRPLGAGVITTDVLGSRLTMTTDEPLWLLRADQGVVVLGLGALADDTNTLTIVRPGELTPDFAADDLESLLEALPGSQEKPIVVGGRTALWWRLLDPAGTALCTPTCRPLFVSPPSVALRSDRIVDVVEVPVTDAAGAVVIATSRTDDFTLDLGGPFAQLIATMEFEDVTSLDDPPAVPRIDVEPVDPGS